MNKWSRRGLITAGILGGSALLVGVAIRPGNRNVNVGSLVASDTDTLITSWVAINPDNVVTTYIPHAEMGQGALTALAQMLADEMDVDWSDIRVVEAPAHEEYANYALGKGFLLGDSDVPEFLMGTLDGAFFQLSKLVDLQVTGGSTSVRLTGNYGVRVAGAAAREMLLSAAAKQWQTTPDQLGTEEGYISERAGSRSAPFADFAKDASQLVPPAKPKLKSNDEFKLIGESLPRLDIPAKVDGSAVFSIDVSLPNMRYAAIRHAPTFGSKVVTVNNPPDDAQVIELGHAVAVVAENYWHAETVLGKLDITWQQTQNDDVSQQDITAGFEASLNSPGSEFNSDFSIGDATQALGDAEQKLDATYFAPYLAHAAMEPLNCTAHVQPNACEVWVGSQNPLGLRAAIANELDLPKQQVIVHNCYLGGSFGRRVNHDFAIEAVRISRAVSAPIKLIWSRAEDIQHDLYRPAVLSRFVGGLDKQQQPIAWLNNYVNKHEPAEATLIPYAIPNQNIAATASPTHIPFGVWRSVDHSQHGFFTESFIDELAWLANADPMEFRIRLLAHRPRYRKVLEKLRDMMNWQPSPDEGVGQGVALVYSFGTIVAEAVEVEVTNNQFQLKKICCVADPGYAVNPDGFKAQMEGGITYGLSAALYGEITITNGSVQQSNFHDYPMVRMKDVPKIETYIINGGGPIGGGGEPGTPPIAPAITNAVYAATKKRIRSLPILTQQGQLRPIAGNKIA